MKGMLTGPVTILNWSFPRADISKEMQAKQIALALRDEVIDLEKAGIHAIQVDEPAIREGVSTRVRVLAAIITISLASPPSWRLGCLSQVGCRLLPPFHSGCHGRDSDSLSLLLLRLQRYLPVDSAPRR